MIGQSVGWRFINGMADRSTQDTLLRTAYETLDLYALKSFSPLHLNILHHFEQLPLKPFLKALKKYSMQSRNPISEILNTHNALCQEHDLCLAFCSGIHTRMKSKSMQYTKYFTSHILFPVNGQHTVNKGSTGTLQFKKKKNPHPNKNLTSLPPPLHWLTLPLT